MDDLVDSGEGAFCAFFRVGGGERLESRTAPSLPDYIIMSAALAGIERADMEKTVCPLLAMWLYRQRAITLGQAGDWLRVNFGQFILLLKDFHVPVVNLSKEEFAAELEFIDGIIK